MPAFASMVAMLAHAGAVPVDLNTLYAVPIASLDLAVDDV
jgi:hypothetical protein